LGERVVAENPNEWDLDDSLPDPDQSTWRKIVATVHRDDGTVVDVELLRPALWVWEAGLFAGGQTRLDLEEIEVHGWAHVHSIEASPAISSGPGEVVTGRFITRRATYYG
jgi:hypothetical protein